MVSNQIRPLKKAYLPPACPKQAYRIVALKRRENHFRSKRSRSNVLLKYASARRFLSRRSAELASKPRTWDLFDRPVNRVFQHPVIL